MKISEKIKIIANWLENSENELLNETEQEDILAKMADAFVQAADVLNQAAEEISTNEPEQESQITPEALEEIAVLAAEFDASGDPLLQKQASVLDEILLTMSAPKDYIFNFKKAEDDKIDLLKKKYKEPREQFLEEVNAAETLKAIEKSPVYKERRPLQDALSSRSCPEHHGAGLIRVEQNVFQCSLDHKLYNWEEGFTKLDGTKVPGGSPSLQTPVINGDQNMNQVFDDRNGRLGINS